MARRALLISNFAGIGITAFRRRGKSGEGRDHSARDNEAKYKTRKRETDQSSTPGKCEISRRA